MSYADAVTLFVELFSGPQALQDAYYARLAGIDQRYEAVMVRNGWERLNCADRPWFRPSVRFNVE